MSPPVEPPSRVSYDLEEALELLAHWKTPETRLPTATTWLLWPRLSTKSPGSAVSWGSINLVEAKMAAELLRASEAARRLDMPTKELLRLVHDRKIRYVMVKGIAHVPDDAIEEYRAKAS